MKRLITFTPKGLYCPVGDFYIDPWRPVERAVVSHAHSDHAYPGMKRYYATPLSAAVMRLRLGEDIVVEEHEYGQPFELGGVRISLHPAGHVPGSAQIRVEHDGQVWVATGDYKLEDDGLSAPFEPLTCDGLITEATFGLPIYTWAPQAEVFEGVRTWLRANQTEGRTSVLYAYSFGKAQRLLQALANDAPAVFGHGAVCNVTESLRGAGLELPALEAVPDSGVPAGSLVLAPPNAAHTPWLRRFPKRADAFVSGWMAIRSSRRSRNITHGFVMSDHADWHGLIDTVRQSEARFVQPFCGYKAPLSRYLREDLGLEAPDAPAGRFGPPVENPEEPV